MSIVKLASDLIAIDSVNPSLVPGGAGEGPIADFLAAWQRRVGFDVEVTEVARGRPNVVAFADGRSHGPTRLLCGHTDTVGVEGMLIPAPGQTLLIAAAIDAVHGGLSIVALVALALLAAVLGNSIGYLIGRIGGRPLLKKLPISEARLDRVDALFRRHGGWFILAARFFDGSRQLNGVMAGMLEMPWWRFSFWNLLGALIWVAVWGLGT